MTSHQKISQKCTGHTGCILYSWVSPQNRFNGLYRAPVKGVMHACSHLNVKSCHALTLRKSLHHCWNILVQTTRGIYHILLFYQPSSVHGTNRASVHCLFVCPQGSIGKCNSPKPGAFDFVGKAKWSAWNDLGDLSKVGFKKSIM